MHSSIFHWFFNLNQEDITDFWLTLFSLAIDITDQSVNDKPQNKKIRLSNETGEIKGRSGTTNNITSSFQFNGTLATNKKLGRPNDLPSISLALWPTIMARLDTRWQLSAYHCPQGLVSQPEHGSNKSCRQLGRSGPCWYPCQNRSSSAPS